jgi:hypothetical protein
MPQQDVQGRKRAEKVVAFSSRHRLLTAVITQKAGRAIKALDTKREEIKRNLKAGVPIEEGPHTASLVPRHRKPKRIKGGDYLVLVVK